MCFGVYICVCVCVLVYVCLMFWYTSHILVKYANIFLICTLGITAYLLFVFIIVASLLFFLYIRALQIYCRQDVGSSPIQPPAQSQGQAWIPTSLFKFLSNQVWKTSRGGDFTTSVGNLFRFLAILTVFCFVLFVVVFSCYKGGIWNISL